MINFLLDDRTHDVLGSPKVFKQDTSRLILVVPPTRLIVDPKVEDLPRIEVIRGEIFIEEIKAQMVD